MRKLLLIIVAILPLLLATPALAWGPIAHTEIGFEIVPWVSVDQPAYIVGTVLPDVAMANAFGAWVPEQNMFHAPEYVSALKANANIDELKSFVKGWQTHLASDKVEESYGVGKSLAVYPAVDAILYPGRVVSITISSAIADLMVLVWHQTYPTYSWQPTREWVQSSQIKFNIYLNNPNYTQAQKDAALAALPDYQTYLTLSVKNSLDAIVLRGDAKRDGLLNMGDVITIERMILGLTPVNCEADVDGNFCVDMGDVVKLERIILGL